MINIYINYNVHVFVVFKSFILVIIVAGNIIYLNDSLRRERKKEKEF